MIIKCLKYLSYFAIIFSAPVTRKSDKVARDPRTGKGTFTFVLVNYQNEYK